MLQLIEYSLMALGALAVLSSLVMYYHRSEDTFSMGRLLKGQLELGSREFLANRVGLYLLVMGVMVRYMNQFM